VWSVLWWLELQSPGTNEGNELHEWNSRAILGFVGAACLNLQFENVLMDTGVGFEQLNGVRVGLVVCGDCRAGRACVCARAGDLQ